jgi:hypothetical protein
MRPDKSIQKRLFVNCPDGILVETFADKYLVNKSQLREEICPYPITA